MSSRRDPEREGAQHEAELTQMLAAMESLAGAGAFVWDAATGRATCSPGLIRILARVPDAPLSVAEALEFVHPDDHKRLTRLARLALRGGEVRPMDFRGVRHDGTILHLVGSVRAHFDDAERLHSVYGAVMDVTERRQLEAQLLQSQKLEAIGTLAGGVAHDFNNFLQVIAGHCDLLQVSGRLPLAARQSIVEITTAITRCQELTQRLLAFGRKHESAPSLNDVGGLVSSTVKMLSRLLGDDIELAIRIGSMPNMVRIDPVQFEQVLVNLAINARDAMPRGGILEVSVTSELVPQEESTKLGVEVGAYCVIRVRDTGVGMSSAVIARIFEPFFTTKPMGAGTGLGLSTVHGIVHQARGTIRVDSTPDVGSVFTVYLPLTQSEQSMPAVNSGRSLIPRGSETILLVEDGEQVRAVTQSQLEQAGYRVLSAADGQAALERLRHFDGCIDLLLSDVMMPRMNGPELAAQLEGTHPSAKVLFMSGYTERLVTRRTSIDKERVQLHKPFSMSELLTTVRRCLDGES